MFSVLLLHCSPPSPSSHDHLQKPNATPPKAWKMWKAWKKKEKTRKWRPFLPSSRSCGQQKRPGTARKRYKVCRYIFLRQDKEACPNEDKGDVRGLAWLLPLDDGFLALQICGGSVDSIRNVVRLYQLFCFIRLLLVKRWSYSNGQLNSGSKMTIRNQICRNALRVDESVAGVRLSPRHS